MNATTTKPGFALPSHLVTGAVSRVVLQDGSWRPGIDYTVSRVGGGKHRLRHDYADNRGQVLYVGPGDTHYDDMLAAWEAAGRPEREEFRVPAWPR